MKPYYSREQAEALHRLRAAAGGSEFDTAWAELIADIRVEMASGSGPQSEEAKALGRRWQVLLDRFTNGDSETERMLYEAGEKFRNTSDVLIGRVPDVLGYIRQVHELSAG